jgi:hypothetical protein
MAVSELASRLADLERRLKAVERSNTLKHASVYDASTDTHVAAASAIISADQASRALAQLLASYAGQAAADGIVNVFYSDTEPVDSLGDGDLWYRHADRKLFRWNATLSRWVDFSDRILADVIMQAQATADEKIVTYWQDTPPIIAEDGDLWFDTDNGNRPHRWTGGVTGVWVDITSHGEAPLVVSLPDPTSDLEGALRVLTADTGVASSLHVCLKDASNAYVWVQIKP